MNELSIKPGGSTGVVPQGLNGGNATAVPGGISVSFTNLLQQASAAVGNGLDALNALTDLAGTTADPDPAEPPAPAGDDGRDRFDDTSAGTGRGDDQADAGRGVPDDDFSNDRVADQGIARTDDPGDAPPQGDETPPDNDSAAGSTDSQGDTEVTEASNPDDGAAGETPAAIGDASHQGSGTNGTGKDHAGQVLASLAGLTAAQASNLAGNAVDQAGEHTGQGLFTAMAAVAKQTPVQAGDAGRPQTNAQGGDAGRPQTNANGQQAQANPGPTAQANPAATANNGAAQQAAALSKAVGEGNPVSVRVTVTNEAATLVSQPNSNLAASTVLSGTGGNQSQNGQPSLHGAAGTNHAASQAAGGAGHGQQANAQAAQAQAAAAAGGPAQGLVLANAATQQPQAVAGESTAQVGEGGVGQTTQTQQNAASPTAGAQRANAPRQGVADQVSVQIVKALKAGLDRITIQLRPASLGRIDVQLEVGHDGRVMAVVTADNKNTLDLLQRDARELERALQDAGLQADSGSLSFNLRGQNDQAPGDESADSGPPDGETNPTGAIDEALDAALAADYEGGIFADGRVDIRA